MEKPNLRFWQIWNMSFGFLGIQFGWGLQMANMSAIYQYLGAQEQDIPILWLAAPLTGLLIQPIIGYFSDRTWNRWGRRRPYFLAGALCASVTLLLMPKSGSLWMAAGLLWILDASVNVSMEPFRAFVGDLLPHNQRKSGFAMQSLLIGAGAVLSSALPFVLTRWFGVSSESTIESAIPPTVHVAFTIGAFVFFLAVLYTILTTREYPPDDLETFVREKKESNGLAHAFREILGGLRSMPGPMRKLAWVQVFTWFALFCMWIYFAPGVAKKTFQGMPLGAVPEQLLRLDDLPTEQWLNRGAAAARKYEAVKTHTTRSVESKHENSLGTIGALRTLVGLKDLTTEQPSTISERQLEELLIESSNLPSEKASDQERRNPLVQTIASLMATHELVPNLDSTSPRLALAAKKLSDRLAAARRYQEGVAWAGVCFAAYNLTAFGFAFALLALVRRFSARSIHSLCLTLGGIGLLSTLMISNPHWLLVSMIGVGIAWASILALPYAMLSNALPANKMGFYMGVFNFFIVLPQILASVGLGKVMALLFDNNASHALLLGGVSMILAAVLTFRVTVAESE